MESLKCPSCGSPLLIKIDANEYKCQSCNSTLKLSDDRTLLIIQQGYPCPACGSSNENGVRYCGNCGQKLIKVCRICQSEVRLDIKFCPKCGQEFITSKTNKYETNTEPRSLKVLITHINANRFEIYDAIIRILNYEKRSELYKDVHLDEINIFANSSEVNVLKIEMERLGADIKVF